MMQQRSTQIVLWTVAGAVALGLSVVVLMVTCSRAGLSRPVLIGTYVLAFAVPLAVGTGVSWMLGGGRVGVLCAVGSAVLYSLCYGFWIYMRFADEFDLRLATIWVQPLISTGALMAAGGVIGSWLRSRQRPQAQ